MKMTKTASFTKRLQSFIAVLGLTAFGTLLANANDLYNPDLDVISVGPQVAATPDGWQIIASRSISNPGGGFSDGASSETFCNVQQANGYGLFFKPFQGSTNLGPGNYDLLKVFFYQDNPSSPGVKYTLSGYASCEPNFCGILPAPPGGTVPLVLFEVEFLNAGGGIIQSNAFDLVANGMHTGGAGTMSQLTTPQYTAPAGTVTVRVGATMLNAYSTTGQQSFFVDAFDLESVPLPGSPVVTTQPNAAVISPGGNASFHVDTSPAATTFAWSRNGATIIDGGEFSGATTATLMITGATTNDVGHYQVFVSNPSGGNRSKSVPLAFNAIYVFPTVQLYGTKGDTYEIDRSSAPNGPWTPFSTNKLATVPQFISDTTIPVSPNEFYRQLFLF
jgi:hypothetical protein